MRMHADRRYIMTTKNLDSPNFEIDEVTAIPLSVLVVDDSRLQRRILVSSLKKWNYQVVEASCGEDAFELCKKQDFDIILSDWMMPGMTGLELCQSFRALNKAHYSYFILLTSKSDKGEIARGLEVGADDFLTKPFNPIELHARIRAGERIAQMHAELRLKNAQISTSLDKIQCLYDTLEKDLVEAKKLQQSLVPVRYQTYQTSQVSAVLKSSGHVGGDLVGFFPVTDAQIGIYSIDVSGHGMSSALMTARLAGYLSGTNPDQNIALDISKDGLISAKSPAAVAKKFNELIFSEIDTEHYFTLALAFVDLESGEVEFTQAGHPYPAVQKSDGSVHFHGSGGLPIGLMEGASYTDCHLTLSKGDRILLASDGVTECQDENGVLLEDEGLAEIMKNYHNVQSNAFLDALIWDLTAFSADQRFEDDVSGVMFEFDVIPTTDLAKD